MDSLRYGVLELHVDGFRFDLAAALARELHDVDRLGAFFDIIHQDPVISQVKLIAEPWDLGAGGYQVGNFPVLWAEWNGEYRDTVRRFWKGDLGQAGVLGYRLTGSSDIYARRAAGRTPASTSSPRTTASRSRTSSATTTNTTSRTARTTGTAATTTCPGTAASRGRPTTPRSWPSAGARCGTSWPPCSCSNTRASDGAPDGQARRAGETYYLEGRSLALLRWRREARTAGPFGDPVPPPS